MPRSRTTSAWRRSRPSTGCAPPTARFAAELTVSQAARAREMTQANYRYGAATTIDVLDAQAALTLAESLRVQGLYDHANARAGLRYVMGQSPLEEGAAR